MRQGVSEAKRDALRKNELKELADLLGMTTQQLKDELEEETFGEGLGSVGRRIKEMKTTKKLKKPKEIQKPQGEFKPGDKLIDKDGKVVNVKSGGLMEATAKLKAKGLKEGGMVVKDKVGAIDKSPNSGLITQRGFGASRRT